MKCPTCNQFVESKPLYLDRLGRAFNAATVLLLMKPLHGVVANGVTITTKEPMGYTPVVILPDSIESDGLKWVMYAREYHSPVNEVTLDGYCGQKDSRLYKLADSIGDLP